MENQQALDLVINLCRELKTRKINYCHWKSNAYLDRSASGKNDLDLLISRSCVHQFTETLLHLGFSQAFDHPRRQMPGVLDYYGLDRETKKIVHVHAHYQLIMGHDATKNYHLPIEKQYLELIIQDELFNVPAPEFEFVVLVIRMMIKHFTLGVVLLGSGKLSNTERQELVYLQERISQPRIINIIKLVLPFIDESLFNNCVISLTQKCSMVFRIKTGQSLQHQLKTYARRSWFLDISLKIWRRFEGGIQRRFFPYSTKKKLASGGLMIAIIGGDGSGKTTAINSLNKLLSEEFKIIQIHMGKPPFSLTTIIIRGILKIGRSIGLYPFVKEGSENTIHTDFPTFPGYPWLVREVCTARDRYLAYKFGRRFATNGGLVLCDRFPIPQIKKMDAPQVDRVTRGIKSSKFIKFLARLEEKYYKQIVFPDLLITLMVDPEISVQRKTDETADSVRNRAGEIWNMDWTSIPAHLIDAKKSKTEVLTDLISHIWMNL